MKKKYLFLLVLLPLLSFGQDTTYAIHNGLVIRLKSDTIAQAPGFVRGSNDRALSVWEERPGYLTVQSDIDRSDDRYGFLVIHRVVSKGVYHLENDGTLTQQSFAVVSDRINYWRTISVCGFFFSVFMVSLLFGRVETIQTAWVNRGKVVFPSLQVIMRIVAFVLYGLSISLGPLLFGGSTRFPWVVASIFTLISIIVFVRNYIRARVSFHVVTE